MPALCQPSIQEVSDLSTTISSSVCRATVTVRDGSTNDPIPNATIVWDNSLTTYTNENGQSSCDVSVGWHTVNVSKFIVEEDECYENNSVDFRCYYCGNAIGVPVDLIRCFCPTPTPTPTPAPAQVPAMTPIGLTLMIGLLGVVAILAVRKRK